MEVHVLRTTTLCAACFLLSLSASTLRAQASKDTIVGVWRVVEMSGAGFPSPVTTPEPGLYIFTKKHYSIVRVTSQRGDMPSDILNASARDIIRVWYPFQANSGTYEIAQSNIVIHPVVAKDPPRMAPGAFQSIPFKLNGNTLLMTQFEITTKLTRIE